MDLRLMYSLGVSPLSVANNNTRGQVSYKEKRFILAYSSGARLRLHLMMTFLQAMSPNGAGHHMAKNREHCVCVCVSSSLSLFL
jgi:hypothetical protein